MKNVLSGIAYNYRGLKLGLKTPSLLGLGLLRFVVVVGMTLLSIGLVTAYYQAIMSALWARPESAWLVWLWYLASWLLALMLVGLATVVAFLIAQMLFSVVIMDIMSRLTEQQVSGQEQVGRKMPWFSYFLYLLRQEIPRAVIPVLSVLLLMVVGWVTPLAPVVTAVSSMATGLFLAWDNTDLVPARRLEPFGRRVTFLRQNLGFHLGFGLWFLVPVLNLLFLSFAPVGATLFYLERVDKVPASSA